VPIQLISDIFWTRVQQVQSFVPMHLQEHFYKISVEVTSFYSKEIWPHQNIFSGGKKQVIDHAAAGMVATWLMRSANRGLIQLNSRQFQRLKSIEELGTRYHDPFLPRIEERLILLKLIPKAKI
jgi:hypothetical protein